jgi:tRNA threonylcarbamoyladenosine biosynthesis protein TsaB
MRILALDTATQSCSVAVVDQHRLMAEATTLRSETHSVHLMQMIHGVLQMAGVGLDAVDGFAVTRGPGSFTGLRIGISTVKGLVETTGKPLVGVSTLRTLAGQGADDSRLICPIIDARKSEVYFSRYRYREGLLEQVVDMQAASIEKAIERIDEPCLFVGDGAMLHRGLIMDGVGRYAHFAPVCQQTLRASTVAFLSMEKFIRQETDNVETFVPYYIRKSDAELNFTKSGLRS